MGKKTIEGDLEATKSVEAKHIHINEYPHANTTTTTEKSVDQSASEITFNSSVSEFGRYSKSGSTSITYDGIKMTRTEQQFSEGNPGAETSNAYDIQFPLGSGTLALTSDVPVKLGDLTDRTADMLEEPANSYNVPTLTYRPFIYDTVGNRLYGILPSRVVVEESIDAGQTWTIKALTDVQKNSLFDNSNN